MGYVRILKQVTSEGLIENIKQVLIVILDQKNIIRVTEYISIEWLLQANEHDIFNWLLQNIRKKETYLFHDEKLVLVISFNTAKQKSIKMLEQIKKANGL